MCTLDTYTQTWHVIHSFGFCETKKRTVFDLLHISNTRVPVREPVPLSQIQQPFHARHTTLTPHYVTLKIVSRY